LGQRNRRNKARAVQCDATGAGALAGRALIRFRILGILQPGCDKDKGRVQSLSPLTPSIGINRATRTEALRACTIIDGTSIRHRTQIANAILLGWMGAHHRLEVCRGLREVHKWPQ